MLGNYQVASQLMASREVLSSIELVSSSRTITLGFIQPLTEMNTRKCFSWEYGVAGA
jgi:hypothetical protein